MSTDLIDDVARHNQAAWDAYVRSGNRWTRPVDAAAITRARDGDVNIVLTPTKPVPAAWLGELVGRKVLCLAAAGGQQAPLLAAAGAHVTVFDLSPEQLQQDRAVAERASLPLTIEQGDMRDLSRFADGCFDLIVHPVSNCFIPHLTPLWTEAARVLRPGGELLAGFNNPIQYLFDVDALKQNQLLVRYRVPYADTDHFDAEAHQKHFGENAPIEFGHSLGDQLGGQLRAGLMLVDMYEDIHNANDEDRLASEHFSPFMATRAVKRRTG